MNPADWIKSFGEFVSGLNLPTLLSLSNGLAGVALVLATLLILIAIIRGRKVPVGSVVLVVFFCLVALALVGIDRLVPPPKGSVLHITAATIPKAAEAFPIHLRVNKEDEWDVLKIAGGSMAEALEPGDSFLNINVAVVADMLEKSEGTIKQQQRQISTLLRYAPKDRQRDFLPDEGGN